MDGNSNEEFWRRWNKSNKANDAIYDDFDEEYKDERGVDLNRVEVSVHEVKKEENATRVSIDYLTNRLLSTLSLSSPLTSERSNKSSPQRRENVNKMKGYVYKVQTKHSATFHAHLDDDQLKIVVGDFVIIEADRGEALGVVTEKVLKQRFKEVKATAGYRGKGNSAIYEEDRRLIRQATKEERIQLPGKLLKEEEATKLCRDMIKKRGLDLAIINSEYQFDGGKLTFFYQANLRIDFRELVCELFTTFKTRIWMQQGMKALIYLHALSRFSNRALKS